MISRRHRLRLAVRVAAGALGAAGCAARADAPAAADAVNALRAMARPLASPKDLDPLMDRVGSARLVLLGESTHGTSEYYAWRASISRRLIEEKGFRFLAVEGDWAPLYRLNRYVRGMDSEYATARDVMRSFTRWPVWMWANEETLELIEWMREFNAGRPFEDMAGFYGMDVYGEDVSLAKAVGQIRAFDEDLADEVADAFACFDLYRGDLRAYARSLVFGGDSCESALERAYRKLREAMGRYDGLDRYLFFAAKQNARVVKNAERHFRLMMRHGPESWNARVDHFHTVVERLLDLYGEGARGVVWAHNTHIGDARATDMAEGGQRNIGQTARERWGAENVVAVGFGTHRGTVQAGRAWGAGMETMRIPEAHPESVEGLMRRAGRPAALFLFDPSSDPAPLMAARGQRAIGVVYHPEHEFPGNYVPTVLPRRYDAFIFIEETRALRPVY